MATIPVTPINKLPWGLLTFLGIKNGGQNPTALGDLLVPVWDTQKIYAETNAESLQTLPNLAAVGFTAYWEVPPTEMWLVHEFGAFSAPLGAGQSCTFSPAMVDGNGVALIMLGTERTFNTVGARFTLGTSFEKYLPPRSQVGIYVSALAAGPIGMQAGIRYTRFPI